MIADGKTDPLDVHSLTEKEFKRHRGRENANDLKKLLSRKRTLHGKTN
jgi:hypothetical protein